ncbi:hypothetical protein RHMOL_Rhmol10G0188900 [Rhododendron molle]|uniref:Uncharacterized protein n=1 Tax=Rhododendron molle TaxID=49168 RepID=A0ACC0M3T9_RHOML|nr:hypothetical protein RHMOL_Rhmol10G0188900 [Rhododendron molle]
MSPPRPSTQLHSRCDAAAVSLHREPSSDPVHRRAVEGFPTHSTFSTLEAFSVTDKDVGKATLAKDLAFLVDESSSLDETKPKTRVELKRLLELRIKKRVKEQYIDGKFQDLMHKVVANPETLRDAYDSIRVNSNVDLALGGDCIPFEALAEELLCGYFNVNANAFSISTKGAQKEVLVLPNVKLKVVQEAIRIVLEVVYRPHFSKISHGCRSGRGHLSALKYISKEISNPDWWFTLLISKKLDTYFLDKLISTMEVKMEDPSLFAIIKSMFDAQVLNLEFGGFPKGHGLPQEGVLSPILMNLYLDLFDREFYRISMKYETLDTGFDNKQDGSHSKLRNWFRRQMKDNIIEHNGVETSRIRVHCCRFMDEMFFAVSGSEDVALAFKSEMQTFLEGSLLLGVDKQTEILPCNDPHGMRFLGTLVTRSVKECPAVRAVHKLKEKVQLFASQKRESWDAGTLKIGKKWLAHGLKKVKESEIKHLADNESLLSQISTFRKAGMETDHWYKLLLKVWMQDTNAKFIDNEEFILSKCIAEPSLPQELRDSFYEFQKRAEEYISSETASLIALLPDSSSSTESVTMTEIIAPWLVFAVLGKNGEPIKALQLFCYGVHGGGTMRLYNSRDGETEVSWLEDWVSKLYPSELEQKANWLVAAFGNAILDLVLVRRAEEKEFLIHPNDTSESSGAYHCSLVADETIGYTHKKEKKERWGTVDKLEVNNALWDNLGRDAAPFDRRTGGSTTIPIDPLGILWDMDIIESILNITVQDPPEEEFSSADVSWSKFGTADRHDNVALIPYARVDAFIIGECSNVECPTRFHIERGRKRSKGSLKEY